MLVSLTNRHQTVTQNTRDITRKILKLSCIKHTLIVYNHKFRIIGLCSTAGTKCTCTSHETVWGIPVCKRYTSAGSAHGITSQAGFTGHALTPLTLRLADYCNCRVKRTPLSPNTGHYTITDSILKCVWFT